MTASVEKSDAAPVGCSEEHDRFAKDNAGERALRALGRHRGGIPGVSDKHRHLLFGPVMISQHCVAARE